MKNKLKIVLITLFFIISMNNISFASQNDENKNDLSTEEYEVSNETSQNYINKQLEKINISQLEQELKNNELFKDLNLKQYIKDLIKGEAKLTDLINIQSLNTQGLYLELGAGDVYIENLIVAKEAKIDGGARKNRNKIL